MEIGVEGKVLLVTGSTQGVGKAVALEAGRSGAAAVMVTGRDREEGAATVAELEKLDVAACFLAGDLLDADVPARLVTETIERFGRIDGVVNAAALTDRGAILDSDAAFFDRMFAINSRAPMLTMQALIRHLKARRAPGGVVNILSVNRYGGTPDLAVYSASKAATSVLTTNAAYTHRFDRICVNGITLGWTDPRASERCRRSSSEKARAGSRRRRRQCRGGGSSSLRMWRALGSSF